MAAHPDTEADREPNEKLIGARGRLSSPHHQRRRMSRSELADAVNAALDLLYMDREDRDHLYVTDRWIGALERGERHWTSSERRAALRHVTGAKADADLGLYKPRQPESGITAEVFKRVARPASGEPRLPGKQIEIAVPGLGLESRDNWSSFLTVTRLLASQRQAVAPAALLSLVEAHRDCLAMLFREAGSDPLRGHIGAMLAEASIVASRLWSAQGNRSMALTHCAYARHLGDKLHNLSLAATARIFESNLHSEAACLIGDSGDMVVGLRMLDEAAARSEALTPAARARLAAEQAQAFAVLELRRECEEALSRARAAAADIDASDRVGLFSDWSPSRLQVYVGTCRLFLGQFRAAVTALEGAMQEFSGDPDNTNVRLAVQVDLASAYAEVGDLDLSCSMLGDAYQSLTSLGNRRGIARAERARERLGRWSTERVVAELDDRMATCLAA